MEPTASEPSEPGLGQALPDSGGGAERSAFIARLHAFAHSKGFGRFVTFAILCAGLVVGAQTYTATVQRYGDLLSAVEQFIIWVFVAEVVLKIVAEGKRPWVYLRDGWNVFDFVIVAACLLPLDASFLAVLRLVRILRVLRLIRALPKLRILAGALIKSIPAMAYIGLLLVLLFYIYAVTATFLFGKNDPIHFRSLEISMVSLFRVVTLEDWTDIMYIQMYGCDNYGYGGELRSLCTASKAYPVFGALYFISFVLMGTMIILNLFIGVILNGMDEAQKETEDEERTRNRGLPTLEDELRVMENQVDLLKSELVRLRRRAKKL